MNRRYLFLVVIGLIFVMVVSLVVMAQFGSAEQSVPSDLSPTFTGIPLQRPLENPATVLAVDDGKVFAIEGAGIHCYDSQSGESLWNNSAFKELHTYSLVASEGRVFFDFGWWRAESQIGCLNATTGELLWIQKGSVHGMTVKDGQAYQWGGPINVANGAFMWTASGGRIWSRGSVDGFPLTGNSYDGRYLYAANVSSMHFFKLDTVNGTVLWFNSNVTFSGFIAFVDPSLTLPSVWASTPQQVIIQYSKSQQPGRYTVSLDSSTGEQHWMNIINVEPLSTAVYNDLLLFSASDGYFYTLRLDNGITMKYRVDTQYLFPNSVPQPTFLLDAENQRMFWSFAMKTGDSPGNYTGVLCYFDLTTRTVKWTKQMEGEWIQPLAGLAMNNDRIFLTGNNALWIYDASTGDLVDSQQFDGSVSAPVVLGNTTFVAAGLNLFAYVNFTVGVPPVISILSPANKTYSSANVTLTFTLNEPISWTGYSFDGQDNVTISGNLTLPVLSYGSHNLTVYANDTAGNMGTSEIVSFSVAEPESFFAPVIAAAVILVVAAGVGLLVYFKKIKRKRLF